MSRLRLLAAGLAAALVAVAADARAGEEEAVVLPTFSPRGDGEGGDAEAWLARTRRRVDAALREAVQDLGLVLDVSERPTTLPAEPSDAVLVERASDRWVVSPRLTLRGRALELRIVAVAPGSRVLLVRVEEVEPREAEVRAIVMLRDLVLAGRRAPLSPDEVPRDDGAPVTVTAARSGGRAVLALNAAVLGGYLGVSLQRASGDADDRLVYPLAALGTGIGLGAAMLIADEWNVGVGEAWFLSAGAWWPATAGLLLANGYDVQPRQDRYVYGMVGAATGVTLATTALWFTPAREGDAALAHSGGAVGLLLGGLAEWGVEGSTDQTPKRGAGFGAAVGVVAAGAVATQIDLDAPRVLMVDLGVTLGALTGAAAGSPLLFDEVTPARSRWFAGGVGLGALAGGGLALWLTRPRSAVEAQAAPGRLRLAPWAAPLDTPFGMAPVLGVSGVVP